MMHLDGEENKGFKRLALPVLIVFWVAVGVFGFSSSISSVIAEAVSAIGIYG